MNYKPIKQSRTSVTFQAWPVSLITM